jgi:hypothetical protein
MIPLPIRVRSLRKTGAHPQGRKYGNVWTADAEIVAGLRLLQYIVFQSLLLSFDWVLALFSRRPRKPTQVNIEHCAVAFFHLNEKCVCAAGAAVMCVDLFLYLVLSIYTHGVITIYLLLRTITSSIWNSLGDDDVFVVWISILFFGAGNVIFNCITTSVVVGFWSLKSRQNPLILYDDLTFRIFIFQSFLQGEMKFFFFFSKAPTCILRWNRLKFISSGSL